MRLTLTDDEGTVIQTWSIAFELDYDPEDPKADGEHDIYLFVDEHLKARPDVYAQEIGDEVIGAIGYHRGQPPYK